MENLIIYFVIFLIISSLISRLQRRGQQAKKPAQRPLMPERDLMGPVPSEPRVSPQRSGEPVPRRRTLLEQLQEELGIPEETTELPRRETFTERVEPEFTAPEFRREPEFKPPERKAKAKPQEKPPEPHPQVSARREPPQRGALSLRFGPDAVRRGIILAEILGPPRAERMIRPGEMP